MSKSTYKIKFRHVPHQKSVRIPSFYLFNLFLGDSYIKLDHMIYSCKVDRKGRGLLNAPRVCQLTFWDACWEEKTLQSQSQDLRQQHMGSFCTGTTSEIIVWLWPSNGGHEGPNHIQVCSVGCVETGFHTWCLNEIEKLSMIKSLKLRLSGK